jgi:hypothetical protein
MILGYIVLNVVLIAITFWARAVLVRFLGTHGSINDAAALAEFKRVARWNMYGALAFLASGVVLLTFGFMLAVEYGLLGVILVLAFSIPSIFLGLSTKKVEVKARSLECDPALAQEYAQVCEVWVKKALPNF